MLPSIVTTSRSLSVRPAIIAELHHGKASTLYSCWCCFNSLLHFDRSFGFECRVCIQIRLGRTLTTMTSTCTLQYFITYYYTFQFYDWPNCSHKHPGLAHSRSTPMQLHRVSCLNIQVLEGMCQRLVFQTQLTSSVACKALTRTLTIWWSYTGIRAKGVHEVVRVRTPSYKLSRHPALLLHIEIWNVSQCISPGPNCTTLYTPNCKYS